MYASGPAPGGQVEYLRMSDGTCLAPELHPWKELYLNYFSRERSPQHTKQLCPAVKIYTSEKII